jgi:hypothetical protein
MTLKVMHGVSANRCGIASGATPLKKRWIGEQVYLTLFNQHV